MVSPETTLFEFGEFRLDVDRRLLLDLDGNAVPLMPKAFETLAYLINERGRVVTKDELLSNIWADSIVEENNLTQNISILRRAFGEKRGEHRYIATIPGQGYKFVAEVNETTREDAVNETDVTENFVSDGQHDSQENQGETKRFDPIYAFAGGILLIGLVAAVIWSSGWMVDDEKPIRSVAVLPFNIADPNPDTEYLSDGIAESVINSLSLLNDLRVISRNSTFRFRDTRLDSGAIGNQLGVEAIVTGDIRQVGEELVISVRLIRTRDDAQIWGNQYVKRPVDLIVIQGEIAQAVAQNLRLRLSPNESRLLGKRETENPEAWELYHRGRFHVFKLTPDELEKGLKYFREAIQIDPNYALAYSGIGDAYRTLTLSVEMPPTEFLGMSRSAFLKAIELDEGLSEGARRSRDDIFLG